MSSQKMPVLFSKPFVKQEEVKNDQSSMVNDQWSFKNCELEIAN